MAMQTDIHPNECYDFTKMIENSRLLLLNEPMPMMVNEPLMVFNPEDPSDDDCTLVLDACSQDFPIFDADYLQFESPTPKPKENFVCLEESKRLIEKLPDIEILYRPNEFAVDRPEFVDVNDLTAQSPKDDGVIILSDDDDVVFVGTFQPDERAANKVPKNVDNKTDKDDKKTEGNIRRNPVRSARNKSRDLKKELIYEEDFAFLDTSEEEEDEKENKFPDKKASQSSDSLKEWPINAHERPEYNLETQSIEAFDYTIREIQKKIPTKKPRLETVSVRRKPKKKYFSKRRKTIAVEEPKVPIEELRDLVESTTFMLKDFLKNCVKSKAIIKNESEMCSSERKLAVLQNQVTLLSVVTNIDISHLAEKFSPELPEDSSSTDPEISDS